MKINAPTIKPVVQLEAVKSGTVVKLAKLDNHYYITTSGKDGKNRMVVDLVTGSTQWSSNATVVTVHNAEVNIKE